MKWNFDKTWNQWQHKGYIGTDKTFVDNAYHVSIANMSGAFGNYPAVRCDVPFKNMKDANDFRKKLQSFIEKEVIEKMN